jgi:putative ABC transport system permease protein
MFKNYFKVALRNIKKNKTYSIINIFGLAIGMACSILIMLYVADELSYDRFHKKADNIYRVTTDTDLMQSGYVADVLLEFPEVQNTARIYATKTLGRNGLVSYGDKGFYTENLIMADPGFFDVFTFQFIKGNSKTSLSDTKSIVITRETARKYFGSEEPIGKILKYENQFEFQVTGVLENPPHNSHLKFDFIIPLENYKTIRESPNGLKNWYNNAFITYVVLKKNTDTGILSRKLQREIEKRVGEKYFPLALQRMTDIHLHSHFQNEIEINGYVSSIYIFSTIAIFILLIAGINYVNLSTTRSLNRAGEVGIRKVVGAGRMQLIRQFLGESILFSILAFLLAIIIITLFLPAFNGMLNKEITLLSENFTFSAIIMTSIVIVVGLFSGIHPAILISNINPVRIIKGTSFGTSSVAAGKRIRNSLLVVQFIMSIGLIISTLVISNQMEFIQNKNLGFTKEQIIVISSNRSKEVIRKIPLLKEEILQSASILDAAACSNTPGNTLSNRGISMKVAEQNDKLPIQILWLDHDFFKTYRIKFAAGRAFSKDIETDTKYSAILNESAVKMLGFTSAEDIIGKQVTTNNEIMQTVIGVTKDFHFMSLHEKIKPIIMQIEPLKFHNISARISTQNIPATIAFIKEKWNSLFPNRPFEYYFVDSDFGKQYSSDQKMNELFKWFSILAIIIACMGLFSLASLTISQKTKEIGIRKILGASIAGVFFLLSKEFIKWIIVANVIAWPAAYFFMNKWLQDFAYRIDISWWIFLLSGGIALVIALATVSFQAIKAAVANPVEALRYE